MIRQISKLRQAIPKVLTNSTLKSSSSIKNFTNFATQRRLASTLSSESFRQPGTNLKPLILSLWGTSLTLGGLLWLDQSNSLTRLSPEMPRIEKEGWSKGLFENASNSNLDLKENVIDGVVNISSQMAWKSHGKYKVSDGKGTGMCISSNGHILTNAHVLDPALAHSLSRMQEWNASPDFDVAIQIQVDGKWHDAMVLAYDGLSDLAILKIDVENLKPVTFAPYTPGDKVYCVGLDKTVNVDLMTRLEAEELGRWDKRASYWTGKSNVVKGFSGGPMCTEKGVIGVTTFVDKDQVFALDALEFIKPLIVSTFVPQDGFGGLERPWLGAHFKTSNDGVIIDKIAKSSPAYKAGIEVGDKIVAVNGSEVSSVGQVMQHLPIVPKGVGLDSTLHLEVLKEKGLRRRRVEVDLHPDLLSSRNWEGRVMWMA